ncbi:hypothetical protein LTR28_005137 [Elasticomyces elasticus]|nr:hypothetical protein LTR28_005137 [Elasticomyces elasticus]
MTSFTTFDIMGDLTFAEPLYMLEGSEYSPWVKTIFQGIKVATWFHVLCYYPPLDKLAKVPYLRRKQLEHFQYSADRVDRRLASKSKRPDLWGQILKHSDDRALSIGEMHSNSSLLMLAGTETTATGLSGLTYHLLRNPRVMEKLTTEIRSTFASDAEISFKGLQNLPYLEACLEEGLRMYPPVPSGMPRSIPAGGIAICGQWVPGGVRPVFLFSEV